MYTRLLGLAAVLAAAVVTGFAQQPQPSPRAYGVKARLNDVPTAGHLSGLRTEAPARPDVDATGLTVSIPNVWEVDPATGAQYRRGEVLVRFRAGVDSILRARALRSARATRVVRDLPDDWSLVELEPAAAMDQSVNALRSMREVEEVSLNFRMRARQLRPNDEFFRLQWNFDAINLPAAWQINPGARNDVVVAVADTGMNTVTDTFVFSSPVGQIPVRFAAVPDLVTADRIVDAHDFVYDDQYPLDLQGHGTHVAGTIAQQTNNGIGVAGIAYNVKLMPLKVLSDEWDEIFSPGNQGGSVVIVAEAIRYAADHGAKVINLSLGGPGAAPSVRDAISYAVSQGAFVAIASGNSGEDGNPVDYPAAYAGDIKGAMAVGAVNRSLQHAAYSTFHSYVEVCAPGGEFNEQFDYEQGITQITYDDFSTLSFLSVPQMLTVLFRGFRPTFDQFEPVPYQGTSMAAPHVAGVAALLYSQGIHKPAAIEEAIKQFSQKISASADECGAGLIDARRALRGLGLAR